MFTILLLLYFESLTPKQSLSIIKVNHRLNKAKATRNKRRHEKLSRKQKTTLYFSEYRTSMDIKTVKEFLYKQQIRHGKLPPIHKKHLRIKFINPIDLTTAKKT